MSNAAIRSTNTSTTYACEHPQIVKRRLECIQWLCRHCVPGGWRSEADLRCRCVAYLVNTVGQRRDVRVIWLHMYG